MNYQGIEYDVPGKCPGCGLSASDDIKIVKEISPYGEEYITVTYKCRVCGKVFEKIFYK